MATINSNEYKNVRNIDVSRPYDSSSGIDQAQWDANPYANTSYRISPWQNFLMGLGFRTKYDAYKESMQVNANEYYSQLAEKAHNEEYDSPLAQAQRMAEAGLNPDLQDISGGSSSPMEPDPNGPIAPGDEEDIPYRVATGLMGCIESLFGLVESGYAVAQLGQNLEGKRLDNDKAFMDNALDAFLNASISTGNTRFNSDGSHHYWRFGYDKKSRLGRLLGRRAKKYSNAVNLFRESLIGQEQEAKHGLGRAHNRAAFSAIRGRSTYSEFDDVLDAFEGTLADLARDVEATSMQKDVASNVYEAEKIVAMDAGRLASAEMSGAENAAKLAGAQAEKTGVEKKMADARYDARNSLDALSGKLDGMDGLPATLGRILVDLLKTKIFGL